MKKTMKMSMKMSMKNMLSMAAAVLTATIMTACAGSDDTIADTPQLPENQSKTITLTTTVGLGGGANGGATTRALTDASGLLLPAPTMTQSCYFAMFWDCSSLTTAPALPATTLAEGCYFEMFEHCMKLNSVTCLATNISATNCTRDWLHIAGTQVTGTKTFTTPSSTNWEIDSPSGIPNGWTRVDY